MNAGSVLKVCDAWRAGEVTILVRIPCQNRKNSLKETNFALKWLVDTKSSQKHQNESNKEAQGGQRTSLATQTRHNPLPLSPNNVLFAIQFGNKTKIKEIHN